MKETEKNLRVAELDVEESQQKLKEAEELLRLGQAKAFADYEMECAKLTGEVARARLNCEKDLAALQLAKTEHENGFVQ
jgi:hypothetical protein